MVEMRCARMVSAYSLTVESGRVSEVSVRKKTGASAGFTFRTKAASSWSAAAALPRPAIAELTSCAAASMSRSSEELDGDAGEALAEIEVIWSMPAIVENCFSRVVATAAAMVSGLAPGRVAETWIVGKIDVGQR